MSGLELVGKIMPGFKDSEGLKLWMVESGIPAEDADKIAAVFNAGFVAGVNHERKRRKRSARTGRQ